jgi:hypothetical protein
MHLSDATETAEDWVYPERREGLSEWMLPFITGQAK